MRPAITSRPAGATRSEETLPPAKNPCGSCPYRCDVPSGVWDASEYAKLPLYDKETFDQPQSLFACHQGATPDGMRLCAGWVAVHDMEQSLSVRLAARSGRLSTETAEALFDYTTAVSLFSSGAEAAAHGMTDAAAPGPRARRTIDKLVPRISSDSRPV